MSKKTNGELTPLSRAESKIKAQELLAGADHAFVASFSHCDKKDCDGHLRTVALYATNDAMLARLVAYLMGRPGVRKHLPEAFEEVGTGGFVYAGKIDLNDLLNEIKPDAQA